MADARWRPREHLKLSTRAWRGLCERYPEELARASSMLQMRYALNARYQDFLSRLQDLAAPPEAAVDDDRLLFVLGHWRSGTTLLHELLATDPAIATPSTWACFNPHHFLLTESALTRVNARAVVTRPMDAMQITWSSPQEDEFALLCLGARSPYEALLVPDALPRLLKNAGTFSVEEGQQWLSIFSAFCAKLQARAPGRMLVLKSPPHGWRLALLKRAFPRARFVHIVRNPVEVATSTRRMWREMTALYALTPPPDPALDVICEALANYVDACESGLAGVARATTVRLEDLVARPTQCLESLYAKLALPDFERAAPRMARYLEAHRNTTRTHAPDAAERATIERVCEGILRRFY